MFAAPLGDSHGGAWRRRARELAGIFSGIFGSPGADWLVPQISRRGGACQAGEARALAAAASRTAARPHSWAAGQAEAIAILMRRTLMRTSAPILSSLRRMVPQVASARTVSLRAMRRSAHKRT